jgi:NAD-dependent dihydropyrimidine dehydrogenase PreA subunit
MPPKIDQRHCIRCGRCLFVCGREVFKMEADRDAIRPAGARECVDCSICAQCCPTKSIAIHRIRRYALS